MKSLRNLKKRFVRKGLSVMVAFCCVLTGTSGLSALPAFAEEIAESEAVIPEETTEDIETAIPEETTENIETVIPEETAENTEAVILEETAEETVESNDASESVSSNEEVSPEETVSEDSLPEETLPEEEPGEDTAPESGTGTVTFSVSGGETLSELSEGASGITVTTNSENKAVTVAISSAGEYTLSGSAVNTCVTVAKNLTDGVTLNLDGLSIDNTGLSAATGEDYPVIAVKKSGTVLTVKTSGTNTLTGSESFSEEAEAVIKAPQSVLNFTGSGTLNITNCLDDAVKSKDGTINIVSGTINISNCQGDGLKAKMEDVSDGGNINISGGTLNINNEIYGDGIQGENVNISDGTVNITTVYNTAATGYYTSGSTSAEYNTITENEGTGVKTERINIDTGSHKAIKAGTKAATCVYKDGSEESCTTTASGGLKITGGTINIDTSGAGLKANRVTTNGYTSCANGVYIIGSPDDALHSNNDLVISGGSITINSSDDALGAAGTVSITGSGTTVNIESCFEGIEGKDIIIGTEGSNDGPALTINSADDGINAAHKTATYTYDSADNEDYNYTKTTVKGSGNTCKIYSGTVTIKIDSAGAKSVSLRNGSASSKKTVKYRADGDGIDCNGTLDIRGGTTYVFGASPSTANSPLDSDSGFTLGNGATLLGVGCDGMNESTPGYGDAVYMTYGAGGGGAPGGTSATASITAGSDFTVKSGNETLINTTLPYAASFLIYSSPSLSETGSYTVSIGGKEVSVTLGTPGSSNPGQPGGTPPTDPSNPGGGNPGQPGGTPPADPSNPGEGTPGQPGGTPPTDPSNPGGETPPTEPADPSNPGGETPPSEPTDPTTPADPVNPGEQGSSDTQISFYLKSDSSKTLTSSLNLARNKSAVLMPLYKSNDSQYNGKVVKTTITWTSSDESVVKVTSGGKITAVRAGTDPVTITAKTTFSDNSTITGECVVTVVINPTSAALKKSVTLEKGKTFNMGSRLVITPSDAEYSVSWSSSDTSKVTVDSSGVITGVAAGKAKLTAVVTSSRDNGKSFSKTITKKIKVIEPLTEEQKSKAKLKLNKKKLTLGSNVYYQFYASASPAVYDTIKWSISDGAASVIDPETGFLKTGSLRETVTVTASMDGKTASCIVTVAPVTDSDLSLDSSKYSSVVSSGAGGLKEGKKVSLKASLTKGTKFANKKLIWASSDTTVATVKNGKVKAVSAGTDGKASAVITVYSLDNPEVRRSVTITVIK
ncbi:MAG: carbohydrate-binding domain-containing protein [Lachnospiraceae bacterium]|nr:carbohydrate-binding domain-containing protein [Lachnospiraceae bacterium]